MMTPMSDTARRSRVTLIALAAGVVLVVVIALIAVFARGDVAPLDAATPEGVVQRYAQAVVDDDVEAALTYLAPEIAESCVRVPRSLEDLRVTLLETTEREDSASVRVLLVTVIDSGPIGVDEYKREEVFDLVRIGGEWKIETPPFQFAVCENGS